MMIWTAVFGFLAAMILTEAALRGTKLQTGLARVLFVHFLVLAAISFFVLQTNARGIPVLLLFWSGAFLTWFGVRSHIESSILLRFIYLLRQRRWTEKDLIGEYESYYGMNRRLDELFRGGLLIQTPEGAQVSSKGRMILRIVSLLRS